MKKIVFHLLLVGFAVAAQAQTNIFEGRRGIFYFGIGTHKAFYTRSDLHLEANGNHSFDLTLEKLRAKDDFFLKKTGGAPQYDYKMGYYSKQKNFGIEFNFDHVKYFVRKNQVARTVGTVDGEAVNAEIPIGFYVENFEHSDGANYALFNFVKWRRITKSNVRSKTDWVLKAGAGPVIPKTNSTIMGSRWDDRYKIAGYVLALEAGLKYNFHKNFFIEPSFKGAWANYTHFLIKNGSGNQSWFSAQFILAVGTQFCH